MWVYLKRPNYFLNPFYIHLNTQYTLKINSWFSGTFFFSSFSFISSTFKCVHILQLLKWNFFFLGHVVIKPPKELKKSLKRKKLINMKQSLYIYIYITYTLNRFRDDLKILVITDFIKRRVKYPPFDNRIYYINIHNVNYY